MQQRHLTIAGKRYALPHPFHVLATQNPLEHEGTYPLPEAQLDRFLMEIDISYPDLAAERRMLFATTGDNQSQSEEIMTPEDLMAAQQLVRRMPVGDSIVNTILQLVRRARPGEDGADPEITKHLSWGPGPRASQAFMLAARAKCLMEGRLAPSIDDINDLAQPVLKHRMALSFAARAEGLDIPALIRRLCASLG
jgi:MoxR-like ATPase